MRRTVNLILVFFVLSNSLFAQNGDVWDLRRCIEYGMARNIDVRRAENDLRNSEINLKESKFQQIPSVNFQGSQAFSFGRSVNPVTNIITDNSSMNQNLGLSAQGLVYNFGSQRHLISANDYLYQSNLANVERARNDIGLNVANQYLTTLLQLEQANILQVQFNQTKSQYLNTRKLVDAGSVPELNAVELEAQMQRDSAALVATQTQYEINLLVLKALLTLPADTPFVIATPPVESIPVDNILETTPSGVYDMAIKAMPQIRRNQLNLKAMEENYRSTRATLYPSISAFAQLNTRYFSPFNSTIPFVSGYSQSGAYVIDALNQQRYLYTPDVATTSEKNSFGQLWNGYGRSLKDNFGQNVGLALNIPIFNGWRVRSQMERNKVSISNAQLTIEQESLKLKQDVYTAYQTASGNYQTFIARDKAVKTAERSFELATKRYEYGVLQTIEWLTIQNNLSRARVDRVIAQFNYVFSMKVLEFYKGQGIRL